MRARSSIRVLLAASSMLATMRGVGALASEPEDLRTALGWVRLEGAEDCISARDLAIDVEKRLGRSVFVSPANADASVEGVVSHRATGGFSAVIVLRDAEGAVRGRRELSSDASSCGPISEEVALVLAVMLDPNAALFPGAGPSSSSSASASSSSTATKAPSSSPAFPKDETPAAAPAKPSGRWRLGVAAAALGAIDLLPSFAAGVGAYVSIDSPRLFPIVVFGEVWVPQHVDIVADTSTELALVDAGATLCPLAIDASSTRFLACGGASFGALRSTSSGLQNATTHDQLRTDVRVDSRLTVVLAAPLVAVISLSVLVPLRRDTFVYEDATGTHSLYRPSAVALLGGLGLGVDFF